MNGDANRPGGKDRWRVMFIVPFPPGTLGGIETVAQRLSAGLARRGHEVRVLVFPDQIDASRGFEDETGQAVDLEAVLASWRPDVVVNHHCYSLSLVRRLARRRTSQPLLSVLHTSPSQPEKRFNWPGWAGAFRDQGRWTWPRRRVLLYPASYWLKIRNNRLFVRRVRELTKVSERQVLLSRRYLEPFAQLVGKKLAAKVAVVPNPLRYEEDEVCPANVATARVLLFVGRMTEEDKRPSLTLRVWAALGERRRGWRLVMVGDGPARAALERRTAATGPDAVEWVGAVGDPRPYYRGAGLLLMTSAYEGLGMVLMEAMQHGVPVVAVDTFAALHDLVVDGVNGLIVPDSRPEAIADRVAGLMADDTARAALGRAATEKLHAYRLEAVVEAWERLFAEVAERRSVA